MNKKGFALTETLVVVVFLVSIFTFIYVSIIPLLGKYENVINSDKDIEVIYKLYHIRKVILSDEDRDGVTVNNVSRITCDGENETVGLHKATFCNEMMRQMGLRNNNINNYVLIYANGLDDTNIGIIKGINAAIGEYAFKYKAQITKKALFLLDETNQTIAHLYYDDSI